MKKVFPIFFIWLLAVNFFGLLALNRLTVSADTAYQWIDPQKTPQQKSWNISDIHAHWDSWWYYGIAEKGYQYRGPDQLSNVVFFPLYPLLMKAAAFALGGNLVLGGWLVSACALLLALYFLHRLVEEFHPSARSALALWLLLLFPTAVFLNSVYTESLFLFLSVASFYFARKNNFAAAAAFGFFAAATRVTGVLLLLPLLMEYWSARRCLRKDAAWLLLVPAGLGSFFAYHWYRFGSPLIFFAVEKAWGRDFHLHNLHSLAYYVDVAPAAVNMLLDFGFVALGLFVTAYTFVKIRKSYAVYMALTMLAALSTGTVMSIGRYLLVLFPISIAGAHIKNEHARQGLMLASVLLFALYTALFVNNYWAG